jgi:hypothetical protein
MKSPVKKLDVSRRDFGKLTLAAFGGILAGSLASGRAMASSHTEKPAAEGGGKHACCGLNTCKGQGAGGKNECAGMGSCATVEAHGCGGHNDCKNQGAQYDNACKGKGCCAVPVKGDAWKTARANFEATMKAAERQFGAAPESCGK